MIQSFADQATEDIFNGINSKSSRKRLDSSLHSIARRKLDMLNAAHTLKDLEVPPGNRLEKLKGTLKEMYSIRINGQHRILFHWTDKGAEQVEIIDYH
jgi:toxin HigB-1